jgi:agarase
MWKLLILTVAFINLGAATEGKSEVSTPGLAGERALELHQRFFGEIVKNYPVETKTQANAGFKTLTHLTFFDEPASINGRLVIPVPFELNDYIFDFRTIEITGSGLEHVTRITASGEGVGGVVVVASQQDQKIQITASSVMASMDRPFSLVLEGEGTVDKVQLVNYEGISFDFDAAAFQEPGSDLPVKAVSVQVDATRYRSIGGICELKPERYFRYYAAPNADRSGMEPYFRGKGFLPGRQIEEIGPAYEDRWGAAAKMPHLEEDPERPGYADPAFFERPEFRRFEGVDPSLEFIMCFDSWPRFMWPKNFPGVPNQRGTPAVEHFDAAADVAARLIAAQIRDSGRTATWWEVKNEADVKSEWLYHHEPGHDGWDLLADFHNRVARRIRSEAPDVKVGGPASAWLQPHRGDFAVWRNHQRFMDETRDHLDFYSLHFYEMGAMDSMQRWRGGSDSYVQGGQEVVLDMLQAHMVGTGNRKPLICSEYGSLDVKRGEQGWWMHIKNVNAMLLGFLNRPDEFDITVPFLLTYMHWAPDSPESLIQQTPDGEFVKTKNTYLIDLWEGYRGKRIPVKDSDPRVITHAVLDGRLIRLAVNNRTGQRTELNVSAQLPEGIKILSVRRKAVVFGQGETRYVDEPLGEWTAVPLGVDGTCILEIELDRAPVPTTTLEEISSYAPQTAVEANAPVSFEIKAPEVAAVGARLRVGLHREGGFSTPVRVDINGETHVVDVSWSAGIPHFLDTIEIPVNPEKIEPINRVVVRPEESGATVTAVKMIFSVNHPSLEGTER